MFKTLIPLISIAINCILISVNPVHHGSCVAHELQNIVYVPVQKMHTRF